MKKKKILLLGGAGFIGLGIAKYLGQNRNYDITIADIYEPDDYDVDFNKVCSDFSINYIMGDFSKFKSYDKLDLDYDYIYMLASIVGVNHCIENPQEVLQINTDLIQNTIKWRLKCKSGKILFSSSSECYVASTDNFNYPVPTDEKVPLAISDISHPRFTYAITKMLGESFFINFAKAYKFPVTIVRYQNIFGPRMGFKHVIPHLVERFHFKENPFKIYGANQTRAFCYITDAAEGTVLAMESKKANQQIFHIGSTSEITISELTKEVGKMMNYSGIYQNSNTYPGSVERRCPDINKSETLLNYSPKINWKTGLYETVTWYKNYFSSNQSIKKRGFKSPEDLSFKENLT